ncbi:hypothetical protein [Pseudomonas sp. M47T1]|nr:hypothetical protein [Pseudomonas sp. M47T1]
MASFVFTYTALSINSWTRKLSTIYLTLIGFTDLRESLGGPALRH